MFHSATYGNLELNQIPEKIRDYFNRMKMYDVPLQITVGTDSQNHDKTKIVSVIAVICAGHGGIYFYETSYIKRIDDVRAKLTEETQRSLELTNHLVEMLEQDGYEELRNSCLISIHVDAGWSDKGKTKELIPMLVGWINACGYECEVKPEAFVSSCIADRISK